METTTREGGYICVANITSDSHLAVSTTTLSGAQLEELEYVLLEAQVLSTAIRKRSDPNDMQFDYSSCEARFIPAESYYILIWVCLPGAPPPGIASLRILCNYFGRIRGINRCWLPGNVTVFESVPAPPPSNLTVTFILLDPTSGRPLSSTTALQVLALKGAVEKMGSYGYQVTGFSKATAASAGDTQLPNSSSVGFIAAGVTTVLLVLLVAICVTIAASIIARKRNTKRRIKLSQDMFSVSSIATLFSHQHDSGSPLQDSPYSLIPAEKETMTFPLQPRQSFVEDPFDDPVYASGYTVGQPSDRSRPQAAVSLHLGVQSFVVSNRAESTFCMPEPSGSLQVKGHPGEKVRMASLHSSRPVWPRQF